MFHVILTYHIFLLLFIFVVPKFSNIIQDSLSNRLQASTKKQHMQLWLTWKELRKRDKVKIY